MLAHNKPAGYVKEQEHGHARFTQPQSLPQPLQQWWLREHTSWGHHSEYDEQRHGPQHQDDHSKHRSDDNVSPSSMHSSPVCIGQTGSSPTEVASITIHPTIANMVSSPASFCSAPSSPPQLSPYRALAPAPSPPHPSASSSSCPRNVSESPEMESNLQQHDQNHPPLYQNKHALVTERRPLLPSPLPPPPPLSASHPPRFRDEIMMGMTLDHPTVAELSSSPSPDSRMDLCEPEHPPQQVLRGWSWSSSSSSSSTTQTNSSSPSPPVDHSCVRPLPYQPQAVSYHLKDGEQQHANQQQRHSEHRQYPDQRAYNYQQYSQAPPWPEHQLKQQLQHRSRHANHTTLRESTVTAGPSVRQRPPTVYPSKKSRASPMSFPEGHSLNASPPGLPQRKSCPVISTSSRTPTLVRPSSSHGPNMHPALVLRDQEEGNSSSPPRPDRDQRRRSIALPLPKNYELMSAAQKMLYERHPPSPKNERYPASSTPSPSTTASSHPSSPSSPSSTSDGSCPPTSPGLAMSMTSKDGTERIADRTQERYSEKLPPLLHAYEFTSEHNRLPVIGHHQPQKQQQQQQQQHHPHHQQQQHSERPGNPLQDPPPKLPSLSSFAFPRARHPHSAHSTELPNRRNSSTRALTSLFPSSSSTSAAMTLSSLSLAPAPTNNGVNGSGHSPCREGSKAGVSNRDLKRSNSMTGSSPSGPGTESTPIIRNEDGAIMVYNPLKESMTFRCELCPGESFGRIHDLKRHQTSKHQEMTWPCDFCHRPFVRRDALLRHYTVKAARDDGLHPASHEVERLLAARARAKMLY